MKYIYCFILTILSAPVFAQNLSKQSVLGTVQKVADNVVKNTTYLYYDKGTGELITDLQKHGYNSNVAPQNGYNDWKYWNGVIHIGFNRLGEETGIDRYKNYAGKNFEFFFKDYEYLKSVYDGKNQWGFPMAQAVRLTELDDCGAMGASLIELYMTAKKPAYKAYIDAAAAHIMEKQLRLPDGIFSRPHPRNNTVWADDLYMSVPFLARMGVLTGKPEYFDEAVNQVILFNKHLFDERTGLMWHCYYDDVKANGGTFWGRCNGWMMMATADLLRLLPADHPRRSEVIALLQRQILNIAQYQSQTGLWHQILNKEDSYLETSCTAMFTYSVALAVNQGWIDKRYATIALAGWKGILTQITREGAVTNICEGTGIGNDIKFYYDRPAPYNDIHGLGTILLAGLEVAKLL
ncbi:MAG: glycoside hydrolase family 88 protein [Dysgonamonadaceae bacterium]|jgi:rhamnogalacturonyl hydrolase YesR|nr:glycoside hydrolase family 88 protein [Dysgonamonadaceae bacterium]